MAALLRLVGPAVARYFGPGPDDMIDTFFDRTPMPVTVEVYPFAPATRIVGQKLSINGASREFSRSVRAKPGLAPVPPGRRCRRNGRRNQHRERVGDRQRRRHHPFLTPLFPPR